MSGSGASLVSSAPGLGPRERVRAGAAAGGERAPARGGGAARGLRRAPRRALRGSPGPERRAVRAAVCVFSGGPCGELLRRELNKLNILLNNLNNAGNFIKFSIFSKFTSSPENVDEF